jgi:hypothetical protein
MITLRFDLIAAYKAGYNEHPQKVMGKLGYKVKSFEGVPIADCVFMEVDQVINPLPEFLEVSEHKILKD